MSDKPRQVALLWGAALGASGLLALAGHLWPAPLPPRNDLALALVALPPVGMALLLLSRWPLTPAAAATPSGPRHRRESLSPEQDQP